MLFAPCVKLLAHSSLGSAPCTLLLTIKTTLNEFIKKKFPKIPGTIYFSTSGRLVRRKEKNRFLLVRVMLTGKISLKPPMLEEFKISLLKWHRKLLSPVQNIY